MKVLGVDYGRAHIGLALGDTATQLAVPLRTLHGLSSSALADALRKVINDERIEQIVAGSPVSLDGKVGGAANVAAQRFVSWLQTEINLPVAMADERLTSRAATRLRAEGSVVDEHALAAMLILQAYLEQGKTV